MIWWVFFPRFSFSLHFSSKWKMHSAAYRRPNHIEYFEFELNEWARCAHKLTNILHILTPIQFTSNFIQCGNRLRMCRVKSKQSPKINSEDDKFKTLQSFSSHYTQDEKRNTWKCMFRIWNFFFIQIYVKKTSNVILGWEVVTICQSC